MILEACVNSAISAIEAERGGADRVELCENMAEGGCTPAFGSILFARKQVNIDLFVMIRPRSADFLYSSGEFEIMKEDVLIAKKLGANGVVFGILNPDATIDKSRMAVLAKLARPMRITCHRAFDMTTDPFKALETLIELGFERILTSGQSETVLSGASLIQQLIRHAKERIIIMPGGGIKEHNLREVIKATGANEYHMYLPKSVPSQMTYRRKNISMGRIDIPEYESTLIDAEKILKAKEIMKENF
jgi:copper homeostasis protein